MELKLKFIPHEQCYNNSFTVNMAAYSLTVWYLIVLCFLVQM